MIGYVYKIESDCKRVLYIGSTIRKLSYRFGGHMTSDSCTISKYLNDSSYTFSNGCELLKEYEVEDRHHLLAYEQLWVNRMGNCINKKPCFGILALRHNKNYSKEWRENNKDRIVANRKKYYETNKEEIKKKSKEYYESNKDIAKKKAKEYRKANEDKIKEYNKKKIVCECGVMVGIRDTGKHKATKKHSVLLESKDKLIDALSFM